MREKERERLLCNLFSFCRHWLSAMSQYFIWLDVNHLSLFDYPPISRFYVCYRYSVAIIDIDGVSLLSLTSSVRISDSLNERLPIKMAREKFQRKQYIFHENDSRF